MTAIEQKNNLRQFLTTMSESGGNPWAWLGLLKWSLSYTDGTLPTSEENSPLSADDKAFLELVMKDGIIDENARMKKILVDITEMLEKWRIEQFTQTEGDHVEELLQELRDIVEQIDYARAFAAMNGLQFMLGFIQESIAIPMSCRVLSLGILSTMCQNNPPVQKKMLELGSLKTLSELFFRMTQLSKEEDTQGKMRAGIIQTISAVVRSNDLAEAVFCQLEQSVTLMEYGIGMKHTDPTPQILRRRTLFFLSAVITSDSTRKDRVDQFSTCISWIAGSLLAQLIAEEDFDSLEMALAMIDMILQQKKSINIVLKRKSDITEIAQSRTDEINAMPESDHEYVSRERELWSSILDSLNILPEDETIN